MRKLVRFGVVALAAVALASPSSVRGQEAPPAWAYVVNPPGFTPPPDDGRLRHVPDSTAAQISMIRLASRAVR